MHGISATLTHCANAAAAVGRLRPSRNLTIHGHSSLPSLPISSSLSNLQISRMYVQAKGEPALSVQGELQFSIPSKTVHVKFMLTKECSFGQKFLIVGDIPQLGEWDPSKAIPLEWSDGHVWSVELVVPANETICFKFIFQQSIGQMNWQPGPDRVLQTWETTNVILVLEDWENAKKQKIEEDQLLIPTKEVTPDYMKRVYGEAEYLDEILLSSEVGEEKSTDSECLGFSSTVQLLPGLEASPSSDVGPDSDVEASSTENVASAYPAHTSHQSEAKNNILEEEESTKQSVSKVGEKGPSEESETPGVNIFNEIVDQAPEEMYHDNGSTNNDHLRWGRETLSKLLLLALGFFVRDLS